MTRNSGKDNHPRKEGKFAADHTAGELNMLQRTVSRHLDRACLSRPQDIEPQDTKPPQRYAHEAAGDMVRLEIKILRKFNKDGFRNPELTQIREKESQKAMYARGQRRSLTLRNGKYNGI